MEILRLITAGSVDDGKSTLIGRMLYDADGLLRDQLASIESSSARKGMQGIDFSLVTDGLKDELQQGITIDIAHKYFSTAKRKYILADTPGHVQYTRNYVTAASNANLAIILIDARKGVVEQTRRHALIASMMGIKHLVFCINKMDLVDYVESRFEAIREDISSLSAKLDIYDIRYIPVSALHGENIVHSSSAMPWYTGWPLLETLENIHISSDRNLVDARFPIQLVLRDNKSDYRACAGQVVSGAFKKGEEVIVLPTGIKTRIQSIHLAELEIETAVSPMSVAITLEDDIDISRGNYLARVNNQPALAVEIDLQVCWLDAEPLSPAKTYLVRSATQQAKMRVREMLYKIDVNNFSRVSDGDNGLKINEIAKIRVKLAAPLVLDLYRLNRTTGSLVIVDETTNATVGAGIVVHVNT